MKQKKVPFNRLESIYVFNIVLSPVPVMCNALKKNHASDLFPANIFYYTEKSAVFTIMGIPKPTLRGTSLYVLDRARFVGQMCT
jgi:hypothetical protein